MLDPSWVFAGGVLGLVGSVRYALAVAHGEARPNLVSWSLWTLAPLIAFLAQLDSGVGLPAVMTLSASVGPLIVVATGLVTGRHQALVGAFDLVCGAISVGALAVWLGLEDAPLAVLLAVVADAVAVLPTLVKAWRHPDSENALFYALVAVGATITLATVTVWTPETWVFAGYQLVACVTLVAVIALRRRTSRPTAPHR